MIADYLKEYFKERKITHEEISQKTGIARSKVTLSLNNKRNLTAEELILIARVYDLNLNKLKEINLG